MRGACGTSLAGAAVGFALGEACAESGECGGAVGVAGAFALGAYGEARGAMASADGGRGGIDVLATWATGAAGRELDVARIDLGGRRGADDVGCDTHESALAVATPAAGAAGEPSVCTDETTDLFARRLSTVASKWHGDRARTLRIAGQCDAAHVDASLSA